MNLRTNRGDSGAPVTSMDLGVVNLAENGTEAALHIKVCVVTATGQAKTLLAEPGARLMEVIRNSELSIRAECGGVCACATCHVYVDPEWIALLNPPSEDEAALLEVAEASGEQSRLSCQIRLSEGLDGLKVTMAPGSA